MKNSTELNTINISFPNYIRAKNSTMSKSGSKSSSEPPTESTNAAVNKVKTKERAVIEKAKMLFLREPFSLLFFKKVNITAGIIAAKESPKIGSQWFIKMSILTSSVATVQICKDIICEILCSYDRAR